jgi:hypothetical protein
MHHNWIARCAMRSPQLRPLEAELDGLRLPDEIEENYANGLSTKFSLNDVGL